MSPIPDHLTAVEEATEALLPKEVNAREHLVQGDAFLVRSESADQTTPSGVVAGAYLWDADRRTLTHSPLSGRRLKPVVVPVSWEGVEVIVRLRPAMRR